MKGIFIAAIALMAIIVPGSTDVIFFDAVPFFSYSTAYAATDVSTQPPASGAQQARVVDAAAADASPTDAQMPIVIVSLIVWSALAVYLFRIDRKISRLENEDK